MGCQLGQGELQHAVVVLGLDGLGVNAGDIIAAAVGTIGAFHIHNLVLFLLLHIGVALRTDGKRIAVQLQPDIVLVKAGQVSFQQEVIALVGYIGLEFHKTLGTEEVIKGRAKETALHLIHLVEGIVGGFGIVIVSACQSKHSNTSIFWRGS